MEKVIIIGGGDAGLTALAVTALEAKGKTVEVVTTIEEIKQTPYVGGNVMEIKDYGLLAPVGYVGSPPPTRAERRAKERKLKKRKH